MALTRTIQTVLGASGAVLAVRRPAFSLRVLRGPDRKQSCSYTGERVLIGSGQGADFRLNDDTVSAIHCELFCDSTGFRVRDLGAKNGVVVRGIQVESAWLSAREELTLGRTVLAFKQLDEDVERPLPEAFSLGRLRGSSARMRELYGQLALAAASDATVLLQGETGTGKELAAEAIASMGNRREAPLVIVDCGALPAGLAESELFGHRAGAFSGAVRDHRGAFERADGGILFLDEIGELPLWLQVKLLGALERRQVIPVGGDVPVSFDVKVIAATHRELEREVNRGAFRADLFYRLAALQIRMPALREHREDIPELVSHFLDELDSPPRLSPEVLQRLYDGAYPGNVRELSNAVERAVLGLSEPPPPPSDPVEVDLAAPYRIQKQRLVDGFERAYLMALLQSCAGNISEASRVSGLSRMHVHSMVQRLGLKDPAGPKK